MTPAELVTTVRSLGAELFVRNGELQIRKPKPSPPELDSILALVREDREGVKAVLSGPVCIDCRLPVTPIDILCDSCIQARKIVPAEELDRRRRARYRRSVAWVERTPCRTCGKSRWHINPRGDSFCFECHLRNQSISK